MKAETTNSALKKSSLTVKPSMSLQYFDEESDKRLEAAFKSVIRYSLGTENKDFVEENLAADVGKKQNSVINASTVGSNSLPKRPKIEIKSKVIKKKKLPSAKAFDGIVFSLSSDKQSDLSHANPVHRCKTCSLSCHDLSGEFWGFPKTDSDSGMSVDDPGGYCRGFDLAEDEIGEFYGFEKLNDYEQEFLGQLEVSGLKECSVVLYKVKQCSVVLHRLKHTCEKNVGPYNWHFPPENSKLIKRAPRKQPVISRTVKSSRAVKVKQEADELFPPFSIHDGEKIFLFEYVSNISITVWDQFQEACNLSLQKEFVDDFCGFGHLSSRS